MHHSTINLSKVPKGKADYTLLDKAEDWLLIL